jgi:hypothetical protein
MKALAFVFLGIATLVALEINVTSEHDITVLDNMHWLSMEHPYATEECLVVAANIQAGYYDDVAHMMPTKAGRCATQILGMRARNEAGIVSIN